MCGIVGFVGHHQAAPILLDGLSKLEYRGYDSAGIAIYNENGVEIEKVKGRLQGLIDKTDNGAKMPGFVGIGHTRWATHGEPTEDNAHPHISFKEKVVGVHNGIIENYLELKGKLLRHDYQFYSETDTEIAINLIEYYLDKYKMGPIHAIAHAMVRIRGSYALAIMFKGEPGKVYCARKDSPLILGFKDNESFIASDVPAIIKYTNDVYYIDNGEIACCDKNGISFYNIDEERIDKEIVHVDMDPAAAEKGGFPHFMLREIYEEPKAVEDTLNSAINEDNSVRLDAMGLKKGDLENLENLYIAACGSAYHTGVVGQYVIEDLAGVPVRVELASEFRYRHFPFAKNSLLIVISQSGETADTLAAMRLAKEAGIKTMAIVNVLGSSIAREADYVFYTLAGPEIAVATTKAYSAQLICLYTFALALSKAKGKIDEKKEKEYVSMLKELPGKIEETIKKNKTFLNRLANRRANMLNAFFIGRGIDYAVGLEGSLKLKEISYIHSEAYAAGELKHGTISLIEKDTLVVSILTQPDLLEKTLSNMKEVQSRGATLLSIDMSNHPIVRATSKFLVSIPSTDPHFSASLSVIPLQLFSYYVSVAKGLDVDKPRNLAKSVTVE